MFNLQNSKRSMNISARPYDSATGLTLEEHIRMESNRAVALSRKGMRSSLSSQSSIGSAFGRCIRFCDGDVGVNVCGSLCYDMT